MTGVHAIHLTVGVALVSRLFWLVRRGRMSLASPQLEVTSLYWHLVDAFWIVLFPTPLRGGPGMREKDAKRVAWRGPAFAWASSSAHRRRAWLGV